MNTKSNKLFPILMLLAGSLLVGFSMGRWLAPLAAWIGPVLILRYSRDHKAGRSYLFIITAYILAFLIGFGGIWVSGFPLLLVPILAVLYGLLWSLPYLADRLLSHRLPGFLATFVYPLAAATLELVNNHINPVGTWGATGFTQYGNLPLMQLVSLTGMIGITFLMGWFSSVVNWAWENQVRRRGVQRGVTAFSVVLVAVFVFGFMRLNLSPINEIGETIRVVGITVESLNEMLVRADEIGMDPITEKVSQSHLDMYLEATVREAQAGARMIVWPEGAAYGIISSETSRIAQIQEVARKNGIYLAIGLVTENQDREKPYANKFVLIDPSGAIVIDHVKFSTNMTEGNRLVGDGILQTASAPFGLLSGAICWDMDYPTIIQQAGQNGIGLMLVPSRDWYQVDPVHTHMTVFRAIENGMSIVRQVDDGLSIAVDPYGRILAQTDFFGATDRTLVAQVPVKHVATIYSLFGSYLEWLAPTGLLLLILRVVTARRQEN